MEQYINLVETATDIIYQTDKNGDIIFVNPYTEKFTGYSTKEIIGKNFTFFIRPDYLKRVASFYVKNASRVNNYESLEFPILLKDKTTRWVSQKVTIEKDVNQKPVGFFAIVRDITELKKIEFEKQQIQKQYQGLIESASDVIYKTDPSGNFLFFNKYTEKLLGYSINELIGKHFTSVIRKDYVKKVALYYIKNRDNLVNYDTLEFPIVLKNGKEMWVSQKVTVERDPSSNIIGFNSIVRDITLFKNIEFDKADKQKKIERFNLILNELAVKPHSGSERLKNTLQSIIESTAMGLNVERISIWNYTHAGIECRYLYEATVKRHSSGGFLEKKEYPIYFKALDTGNPIVASEVSRHPDIVELMKDYFPVLGIRSLLDIPIFQQGELQGVICCESVNTFKKWDTEDVNFARAISNIISISIEAKKRIKAEKQLAFRSEILAAIASTTEKLLVSNHINETLAGCISIIGKAMRVDKVYFYERDAAKDLLLLKQEWYSERSVHLKSPPGLAVIPVNGLGPISETLLEKKYFSAIVSDLRSEKLKEILGAHGILSILILPVYVKDVYYGFIGFDDCTIEREWSADQLNVIQSLATNIANAIGRINNERVIKENENNFRQINETIEDVFWLYDIANKKYVYMSPSCEKVLGMNQDDFYSGADYSALHIFEEDVPRLKEAEIRLQTEPFYELEYRIRHNGSTKWIYEKSFAIHDIKGNLVRNSGICTDITEKKLIQSRIKQLSLVAEKTTNGILIADKTGKTLWANEAYLKMFEIPENELIGKRPRDLFNTDSEHIKTINKLNSTNYTLEFEVSTFTNKRKWVELTSTAITDDKGKVMQQVEVLSDITEKMKNRNELKQYLVDLEFQNILKEKLINAGSIKEITEEALGLIKSQIKDCIHISLLTLDETKQNLQGYYLKGSTIEKETLPTKDIKSFEKIKEGKIFIENNLNLSPDISVSDRILLEYGAVSYAVIPIMEGKEIMGMITITFDTPFHLTKTERGNLMNFSFILSTTIRQLNLKNSLQEKNNDINESLYYAQNIQRTILPDFKENFPSLKNISVIFKPKDIVSGDFYWAWENDRFLFVAVGDCTGHGVPGAFLTLIGSRILEQIISVEKIYAPDEILKKLDKQLFMALNGGANEDINDGMEIALCAINKSTGHLNFSGAGMGLLYFNGDADFYLKGQLESIGDHRLTELKLENHVVKLEGNLRFYMASDGFQDQLGGEGYKRYSRQKLIDLLKAIKDKSAREQEIILHDTITGYMGQHPQTDDVTLLGFTIKQ